jgi:hypothetical protein
MPLRQAGNWSSAFWWRGEGKKPSPLQWVSPSAMRLMLGEVLPQNTRRMLQTAVKDSYGRSSSESTPRPSMLDP